MLSIVVKKKFFKQPRKKHEIFVVDCVYKDRTKIFLFSGCYCIYSNYNKEATHKNIKVKNEFTKFGGKLFVGNFRGNCVDGGGRCDFEG